MESPTTPQPKQRRKPFKTTQATRHYYERRGWRVAYVERYVSQIRQSFDAWGFADFLMFKPGERGMKAVNATGWTNVGSHVTAILNNPRAFEFLTCDERNTIVVVGWGRPKNRGEKPQSRFELITLADFKDGKPPEPVKAPRPKARQCRMCKKKQTKERPIAWAEDDLCWACKHTDQSHLWRDA